MSKNVIILTKNDTIEAYTSLVGVCQLYEWSYNYLKKKKFPFQYKDWKIHKIEVTSIIKDERPE